MTLALPELLTGFPSQPYIELASQRSPGVARVKGLNNPREWDVRQGYGFSGAVVVYKGQGLSKFQVEIDLWEPTHFLLWNVFSTVLKPPIRGAGMALGIKHPVINGPPHGIFAVVVTDVSDPVRTPTGKWTYTISFLQYRKPLPAVARMVATIPNVHNAVPTAATAAEQKMLELKARAEALGG